MARSVAPTAAIMLVILVTIVAVFLLYEAPSKGSLAGGGTGGGRAATTTTTTEGDDEDEEVTEPPDTGSPVPISVIVNDMSSITIQSDYLTSDLGYFVFTLYRNAELTTKYIQQVNFQLDLYTKVQEHLIRGVGYTWDNIAPPFQQNNKQYWIKIEKSNSDMTETVYISKVSFATPPVINLNSQSTLDKIEQGLKQIGDLLLSLVVGETLAQILKAMLDPAGTSKFATGVYEAIVAKMKNSSQIIDSLKLSRVEFLRTVSARFNMFLDIFRFTPEDIISITRQVPQTIKRIITRGFTFPSGSFDDILAGARAAVRYGITNAKQLASAIGNRLISSAVATGRLVSTAVRATLNPVDVVFLAVGMAGMAMDQENVGGMGDWNSYKTSDFLAMKEEFIDKQAAAFEKHSITFPAVNGPLLKYSNADLDDILGNLQIELIFLPEYQLGNHRRLIGYQLRVFKALSRTGYINSQADIDEIENLQVMRDLRELQRLCGEAYARNVNMVPLSNRPSGFYVNTFNESFAEIFLGTRNGTTMNRIAVYILCKISGGNPLSDGQCSYKTATQCFNAYPWPPFVEDSYDPGFEAVSPDSPCPVSPISNRSQSPCLSIDNDFGKTDFFYSEWRKPADLQRDYSKYQKASPIWNDPAAANGVCVIYPDAMRFMCEATTKFDDYFNVTGTNKYNKYTGECTNTKQFCDAYGVSFKSNMQPKDMAWRGSGPLPSCYQSDADKAGAFLLGGEIMIQYLNKFAQIMEDGWRTFMGLSTGENAARREAERLEAERRAMENNLGSLRSDEVQSVNFNKFYNMEFVNSDTVQLVDVKFDPFGNVYIMYAYGSSNGTLYLVKYTGLFKFIQEENTIWENRNLFLFKGSVENQICSKIAVDSMGSLYMLQTTINSYGKYEQSIVKRDRDTGEEIPGWVPIQPESLKEEGHVLAGRNLEDEYFNGIFIKNDILYVTYTAEDKTAVRQLSLFLKYEGILTANDVEIMERRIINNVDDYLPRTGQEAGEEVHSFVVDSSENHYSLFLNNVDGIDLARGILVKYDTQGVRTDISLYSVSRFAGYDANVINDWPGMCIDDQDRIFISNGRLLLCIDTRVSLTPTLVYSMEGFNFNSDLIPNLAPASRKYFPWEACTMAMDTNNNVCMISQRYNFINLGQAERLIALGQSYKQVVYNRMTSDAPRQLDKTMTLSGVELGVDYVIFKGVVFSSDCVGHEIITMDIDPPPTFFTGTTTEEMDTVRNGYPLFRVRSNINRSTNSVFMPLDAGILLFDPNVTYTITTKLNGTVQQVFTVSMANVKNNFYIGQDFTVINPGDYFPYGGGSAYRDIINISGPMVAYGTRTLMLSSPQGISGLPSKVLTYNTQISLSDNGIGWKEYYDVDFSFPTATTASGGTLSRRISFRGSAMPGTNEDGVAGQRCYAERGTGYEWRDTCGSGYSCPDNSNVKWHNFKCIRD